MPQIKKPLEYTSQFNHDKDAANSKLEQLRPEGDSLKILTIVSGLGLSYLAAARLLNMRVKSFKNMVFFPRDPKYSALGGVLSDLKEISNRIHRNADSLFEQIREGTVIELMFYYAQNEFEATCDPVPLDYGIGNFDEWNITNRLVYLKCLREDIDVTLVSDQERLNYKEEISVTETDQLQLRDFTYT